LTALGAVNCIDEMNEIIVPLRISLSIHDSRNSLVSAVLDSDVLVPVPLGHDQQLLKELIGIQSFFLGLVDEYRESGHGIGMENDPAKD